MINKTLLKRGWYEVEFPDETKGINYFDEQGSKISELTPKIINEVEVLDRLKESEEMKSLVLKTMNLLTSLDRFQSWTDEQEEEINKIILGATNIIFKKW